MREGVLAALSALFGAFFVYDSAHSSHSAPMVVEAVAGALAVLGLVLFRRTHPVALMLVLMPFAILLAAPMGFTPIVLFTIGVHRPWRVSVAVAALHAVMVAVLYWLAFGLTREYVEAVAFLVPLHVSVVAIAMLIRSQRQLVSSWAERARQAEEGQRLRVEQARYAERERIAREMHDVLAHRLSLLAVHAGALEVRRGAETAEREAAAVIRRCAYDALEDLRLVIGMVRAPEGTAADRPPPTLGDIPALVAESRAAGAQIGLEWDGGDGVPEPVGRHAYRIVQEALTNARKHAPGAPVRVAISGCADRGLDVQVANTLTPDGGDAPVAAPLGVGNPRAAAGIAQAEGDSPATEADSSAPAASVPTAAVGSFGRGALTFWAGKGGPAAGMTSLGGLAGVPGGGVDIPRGTAGIPEGRASIPGAGAGLAGLHERVELVGGRLEHGPTGGGEFHLRAWLPWPA